MSSWKLGYPSGLDTTASYTTGKALYDGLSAVVITFDATTMCRAVGQLSTDPPNDTTGVITCDNITNYPNVANTTFGSAPTTFETDEFNNGFVKFLSGTVKNNVYKVDDTTSNTIVCTGDNLYSAGARNNDYIEVVTGGTSFTFPTDRNPIRRDFKRRIDAESVRLPYYGGGIVIPRGWSPDDMVIMTYITDERDIDRLELLLNHVLDYKGFDGFYSTGASGDNESGLAPMLLQTGSTDVRNQYLVYMADYKIMKDAKRSDNFWEIMIHFENFTRPIYRGV